MPTIKVDFTEAQLEVINKSISMSPNMTTNELIVSGAIDKANRKIMSSIKYELTKQKDKHCHKCISFKKNSSIHSQMESGGPCCGCYGTKAKKNFVEKKKR